MRGGARTLLVILGISNFLSAETCRVQAVKIEERPADHNRTLLKRLEELLTFSGGLILLGAVAYGVADIALAQTPISRRGGLEDLVLGSSTVVIAARVAALFAAAFFVVSVAALTARRQWLVRVGPVEASERVADFDGEVRLMSESLENALQTIDSLRYELALSNSLLDKGMENSGEAK
jgi:hypothetical protein